MSAPLPHVPQAVFSVEEGENATVPRANTLLSGLGCPTEL